MQSKSTRGVQQEDVWTAADALIAEGLRPTIERVRQKIGRGSPNTVSPMLESWFATLGPRLGVSDGKKDSTGAELPAPVHQAVVKLWDSALRSAQEVAEQGLILAQQALARERASLEFRDADLASREQLLKERQGAIDEALQVARGQIVDLTSRLEQVHVMSIRRDGEVDALQLKLSDSDRQRMLDQRRNEEEANRHADERRRLQEHATSTERRLMTELDRERQEAKRLKSKLNEAEQCADAVAKKIQEDTQILAQRLRDAEIELRSEHQALLITHERANELRRLMDDQRISNGEALDKMSLLLTEATQREQAIVKPKKRVKSKVG
ncbi:conserved hypothetical protein [Rhodoferax ferrireducens T118]|uniref:KfrA N-terminal DNA-binding domain-containing protein n=1 Tax=Albidiferax ferrireducens (strain ATCC BAA-621 / DSM 15236 / T118) TaxID=338969 RepID=Q21W71_ALBFT|nr:DNA-binding protein [Rhodoferax ferrireducens]ABD69982.1 conserved hypothetical protein [Rhodoferax ferrireducens T118]